MEMNPVGNVSAAVDDGRLTHLTTAEAGELLGLSRPFVVRLIDDGVIPAHYAGTHRRVRTLDVLAHARRRQERLEDDALTFDFSSRSPLSMVSP